MAFSAQIGYIVPLEYEIYHEGQRGITQVHHTIKQRHAITQANHKHSSAWAL